MKITKSAFIIFVVTFFMSSVLAAFLANYLSTIKPAQKKEFIAPAATINIKTEQPSTPAINPESESPAIDEYEDNLEWVENYDAKYKIKLLLTGQYHGDEVKARSGESCLGLFKQGSNFSLRSTKIKVKQVHDDFIDEKNSQKTGKEVSVKESVEPIFLLKNAGFLKQGKIRTLFSGDLENYSEETNINNQTSKIFNLDNITYTLFVKSDKPGKTEYLDETSTLILTDGQTEQVIYSQKMCNDCGWGIYWAGDLDGDGKLDLYLDLANHYNVRQKRLFLSAPAEKGKLVKEVANFRIVGC